MCAGFRHPGVVDVSERLAKLERRVAELVKENAALRKENAALRKENAALRKENAALREENGRLRKELEEWKRGHRERGKRRSSRAEGKRRGSGRPRGRRPGHEGAFRPVPKPDETVEHPLPERCSCGGLVEDTGETQETIVQDIPPVRVHNTRHVAHVGCCRGCGKRVMAALPGAVATGRSIAQVQLGPNAQALVITLHYEHDMPMRQISRFVETWFGLAITPGGISQMNDRVRRWSEPSYAEIEQHVRVAPVVGLDETGLRQDGVGGWMWLARTPEASLFRAELSRGSWVAERMLGEGFVGIVCSDFYSVYTAREDWQHAYCGGHLIREAKKVAEVEPGLFTEMFRDQLCDWYADAKVIQQTGTAKEKRETCNALENLIDRPFFEHPEVVRLCTRIDQHFAGITLFVHHRQVAADNNATERDIRSIASYRRAMGGTRSEAGSKSLAHWKSIGQTLRKNGLSLPRYIVGLHAAHLHGRAPPSVFAPS
jgi:transposase